MGLSGVFKGGLWLYIGGLLTSFLGYVYWFIASSFVPPGTIGSAAAITSLQGLLVGVFSLGLPTGLQRFIGMSRGKNDYQQLSTYFFTSLTFALFVNLALALTVLAASLTNFTVFNLKSFELTFVVILILLASWPQLFTSLFNSLLKTEVTATAQTVSSVLRVFVGIFLLYLGLDFVGVILGLITASVTTDIILILYAVKLFREFNVEAKIQPSNLRELLKAGFASWMPNTLITLGQSIGVLSVYGFVGESETGLYYIAFAIAAIVYNLPESILSLMFPVLSGMEDGRKRTVSKAIKISLAASVPIALTLALYPHIPLSLLGQRYVQASSHVLRILVLGAVVSPIVSGYGSYVYAVGKYVHVTLIGLATNMSRLLLYALLIPTMEATGVATAYTLGIIVALTAVLSSAYKTGYRFNWIQHAETIIVPGLLAAFIFILNIQWLIGIPALLLASLFAYARLNIISKMDVLEISQAFISKERLSKMCAHIRLIIKLMYGE